MNKLLVVLGGLGLGAAAVYFFDPNKGRNRRAMLKDKAIGLTNDARQAIDKKARDLGNRAQGMIHEAKSLVSENRERQTEEQTGLTV
jgi:gas vesicle protein